MPSQSTSQANGRNAPQPFRILVVGKSGAGKSSLINRTIGTTKANNSDYKAGVSNINEEIMSETNPHFIVHDSEGFRLGELDNDGVLTKFAEGPTGQALHAVWLCTEIPVCGARVFEIGDEDFLKLKKIGAPVIIVFTKYDALIASVDQSKPNDDDDDNLSDEADVLFRDNCISMLNKVFEDCNTKHPHVKVSVKYKETLEHLLRSTVKVITEKNPKFKGATLPSAATTVIPHRDFRPYPGKYAPPEISW